MSEVGSLMSESEIETSPCVSFNESCFEFVLCTKFIFLYQTDSPSM